MKAVGDPIVEDIAGEYDVVREAGFDPPPPPAPPPPPWEVFDEMIDVARCDVALGVFARGLEGIFWPC